jgi:MFS family permease
MLSFILARAVCGIGAGITLTMGGIMISDVVPIEIRGIYQAYINIVYGVGSVMGAATGGLIAEAVGWRWTFGIQVPILLSCLVVSMMAIPSDLGKSVSLQVESTLESLRTFDWIGSLLLTLLLTCLILGLVC